MKKSIIIITAFLLMINLLSCSDSERRMELLGQTSTVVINLGLPAVHASADMSIIDRVLRFFTRDAIAQTAPATFSSITVRVTGADIVPIEKNFAPFGAISLNVPSGSLRQFEVIAYVAPGDPSAAASFRGTAVANLPAGETVSVPVVMTLNETKIIVPDYSNSRMVTLNSISSTEWTVAYPVYLKGCGECYFPPYDIDFDARGRMYVVSNSSGSNDVIRFDNIQFDNPQPLGLIYDSFSFVAVDRNRNYLYLANSSTLYQVNLNDPLPLTPIVKDTSLISTIYGIDVTPDGDLYILGNNGSNNVIYKYNPGTTSDSGAVEGLPYMSLDILVNPRDIMVRPPYIYVATEGSNPILRILINDTSSFDFFPYGTIGFGSSPGEFYGPRRFLGMRNNALIIIDDNGGNNQLISLDYPSFTGWATASSDIGFQFYSSP